MSTQRVTAQHHGGAVYGTAFNTYLDTDGASVTAVLWDGAISAVPVDTGRLRTVE